MTPTCSLPISYHMKCLQSFPFKWLLLQAKSCRVHTNPIMNDKSLSPMSTLRIRPPFRDPGFAGPIMPTRTLVSCTSYVRALHTMSSPADTHYLAPIMLSSYPLFRPRFLLTLPTSIAQSSTDRHHCSPYAACISKRPLGSREY